MKDSRKIPEWLYFDFWSVIMTGEIYPQIRAIAVKCSFDKSTVLARFYFDREPNEFDCESVNEILSLFAGKCGNGSRISEILDELVFSDCLIKDLDALDGFVYTRREYEMQNNPSQSPTYFV